MGTVAKTIRFNEEILEGVNLYKRLVSKLHNTNVVTTNGILENCLVKGFGEIVNELKFFKHLTPSDAEGEKFIAKFKELEKDLEELEMIYYSIREDFEKESEDNNENG